VLLLPVGQSDSTLHHFGRLAVAVHWLPHFGNRRRRWAMVRHRCPLGLHMRRRWHVYLPRASRLCATTILRNRGPSVLADRDHDFWLRHWCGRWHWCWCCWQT
jgi:hypothetical protein